MPGIVVGVDGSEGSQRALVWAMTEAAIRRVPLTVLAVHQAMVSQATGQAVSYEEDRPELDRIRKVAQEQIQKATADLGERPADVTIQTADGFPAKVLIDASESADMVVVGSRGGGGFARLLLGSVSTQVVHHATCPVAVVPSKR